MKKLDEILCEMNAIEMQHGIAAAYFYIKGKLEYLKLQKEQVVKVKTEKQIIYKKETKQGDYEMQIKGLLTNHDFLSMPDLQDLLEISDYTTLYNAASCLVEKGIIIKEDHPSDQRKKIYRLKKRHKYELS